MPVGTSSRTTSRGNRPSSIRYDVRMSPPRTGEVGERGRDRREQRERDRVAHDRWERGEHERRAEQREPGERGVERDPPPRRLGQTREQQAVEHAHEEGREQAVVVLEHDHRGHAHHEGGREVGALRQARPRGGR